ncbi:alpha/beta hydrolase [Paenibacillus albus]|uniref:Esterase family protein n=1 Tax=Paenibacillus albus TaxID=2495582 RepID=A0A3Q8X2U9_9BACL|nr:alpha/beta hydrolase-fold protein [Paenibacillus albus]AZN39179.1 esterase family protein [Paenibacillus albus]
MRRSLTLLTCCLLLMIGLALSGCSSSRLGNDIVSPTSNIDDIEIYSKALKSKMSFDVYTPPGYDPKLKYPVLYMLYGYGGNRGYVFDNMELGQVTDRLIENDEISPLIIVSPDYGNSFAVNSVPGQGINPGSVDEGLYEDYLLEEVIPYVDKNYRTIASREGRYVGGFSMGGYAALYLGFNHTDLFSKIGGHSAAIWDYTDNDQYTDQRDWLYPTAALRERRDPFKLAVSRNLDDVHIYLDAGENDQLAAVDEKLFTLLKSKHAQVEWHTYPGYHSASYWMEHFADYLKFYSGDTGSKG